MTYQVSSAIAAAPPTADLFAVMVSPVGTEIVPVATLAIVVLPEVLFMYANCETAMSDVVATSNAEPLAVEEIVICL